MQDRLLEGLSQRFANIETNNSYIITTFLNPRFEDAHFANKEQVKKDIAKYIKQAVQLKKYIESDEDMVSVSESGTSDDAPLSILKKLKRTTRDKNKKDLPYNRRDRNRVQFLFKFDIDRS